MQLQDDYFAAYRSLKLTRDPDGVLVVEFHTKGGPFRFTAQDHTEFVAVLTHPTRVEGPIPLFSSAASAHNVVETRGALTSAA
jgi:hypothetical protein